MNLPANKYDHKKIKMVNWYSPVLLIKTGVASFLSGIFGKFADSRAMQVALNEDPAFDYSGQDEIWVDYVSDLGDGWNSTYTIAHLLSKDHLNIKHKEKEHRLPRGKVTIMGGDLVYPSASRDEYLKKTVFPYECALPYSDDKDPAHLFALPGNHDWYDGLNSFQNLFCQNRWIGGRLTRQSRSYFYLKLPGKWNLFALDLQFSEDIDQAQKKYMLNFVDKLTPQDKVILCIAEPTWVYDAMDKKRTERSLAFFENKIKKKTKHPIQIYFAGDLHHYMRFESQDEKKRQKITSGGGGAFLHPTHVPNVKEMPDKEETTTFLRKKSYPDEKTSKNLTYHILLFFFKNPGFSLVLGFLYMLSGWFFHSYVSQVFGATPLLPGELPSLILTILATTIENLHLVTYVFVVYGFCYYFADTFFGKWRWLVSLVHAGFLLLANLVLGWVVARKMYLLIPDLGVWNILIGAGALLLGGAVVGGTLFGFYLFITINLLGRQGNEALGSLRVEDYKSFLRLHFKKSGQLKIYPVGVYKVGKNWEPLEKINEVTGDNELTYLPKDSIDPFLIEEEICIPGECLEKKE